MTKATLAKGVDVAYHWRQAQAAGGASRGAGYYIEAAGGGAEAGEPPGRWYGPAAEHLGLAPGSEVSKGPYFDLFSRHVDPRDGETQLGRAPGKASADAERAFAELLEQEPHATAERQRELRIIAAQRAHAGPAYFDVTLSFNKSVSVFHASIGENARVAHQAGDQAAEGYWSGELAAMDEMIYGAVRAGFDYFQREAGYTRTGHHGGGVAAEDAGRWAEAELAVVHWLQHTSRDGDMQLHVHSQIAHVARTILDGKWRAPDSAGYGKTIGAVGAIVSAHLESAMSARFGVEWEMRADGLGREIRGVPQKVMDLFSSRRASINDATARLAREWEEAQGRKPSQRVLARLAQRATLDTRKPKGAGAKDAQHADARIDLTELSLKWADQLREAQGAELASIAREVSRLGGAGPAPGPAAVPTAAELQRAGEQAVALGTAERPTWTKGDLIRHLGRTLPPCPDAAGILEPLADQILAGAGVVCVTDAEVEEAPPELRRADGRSVYRRPGRDRYTTPEQLAREDRLAHLASEGGAPALEREDAAARLGADADALDAALCARSEDAAAQITGSGLRADQAAALHHAITSPERASVITGPAGSGKTRLLAEVPRIWDGPVIGTATSQAARNVLADATGAPAWNIAQLLGHTKERRGALGPKQFPDGAVLMIDEGSMVSQEDMADLIALARARNAKVLLVGDQEQLAAVEGGGGMALLADRNGYAQLAAAVRFADEWERDASLRLRAGDTSVVAEYDQRGRITGGSPELAMDEAARRYVAHYIARRDALLMAQSHEDCRELSRRIRDDLVHLGYVDPGRSARLRGGAWASVGDLIIARHGDNKLIVGDGGRVLANGDTMEVQALAEDGSLTVRRLVDADQVTGARRYSPSFAYRALDTTDLAYAVTGHSAQGRTVGYGIPFLRGGESRQWTYVAMSRAAVSNSAVVVTEPKLASTAPGSRPAPEVARHARVQEAREAGDTRTGLDEDTAAAAAVLAGNLQRDGAEEAAGTVLRREMENANHLGVLRVIFENETQGPREDRWRQMVAEELPGAFPPDAGSFRARWLYRTLESAELAGLDARQVLRQAVAEGPLAGSRDVAAVVDGRIRKAQGALVPQRQESRTGPVPEMPTPGRQAYAEAIGRRMAERAEILGEAAAEHQPAWALRALGPVPEEPLERLEWQHRAADIEFYREGWGHADPADPIGPEPTRANPRQRAAWHQALEALGPVDGADVRGASDGALLNMRAQYERETAWAPKFIGDELRLVRTGAERSELAAIRAAAEASAVAEAGRADLAEEHRAKAKAMRTLELAYRDLTREMEASAEVRAEWDQVTESTRRVAVAADTEYRRRHQDTELEPLRNAELEPVTDEERAELDGRQRPAWLDRLAAQRDAASERLADIRSIRMPSEDPDGDYDGTAWPKPAYQRDAILQPPKPELRPGAGLARQPEPDREAAT